MFTIIQILVSLTGMHQRKPEWLFGVSKAGTALILKFHVGDVQVRVDASSHLCIREDEILHAKRIVEPAITSSLTNPSLARTKTQRNAEIGDGMS
jgi:hypothetical protein